MNIVMCLAKGQIMNATATAIIHFKPPHHAYYSGPCPCSYRRAKDLLLRVRRFLVARLTHVFDVFNTKLVEFGTCALTQRGLCET